MEKKPSDILEFLRRQPAGQEEAPAPEPERAAEALESTPRLLLVRRSQLVVAAVAVGLALVLAFVLGLAAGGGEAALPPAGFAAGPWVIRAISYDDDSTGRSAARAVQRQLAALGSEVTLQTLNDQGLVVVTVGAWVRDPKDSEQARRLLARVRTIKDRKTGKAPFESAYFWRIER